MFTATFKHFFKKIRFIAMLICNMFPCPSPLWLVYEIACLDCSFWLNNDSFIYLNVNARVFSTELVKPGNVVSGVVERVTPDAIVLDVTSQGHFKGTVSPQHLADHSGEYHPLNPLFLCNCFYCFMISLHIFLCTFCIN